MRYKIVLHTVGRVILFEAILLLLPLAAALIYGESCAEAFIITILIAAALGFAVSRLCSGAEKDIFIREGFAIVSLSWISISAIGALPFVISGEIPSYIDAFFETVSGFTTTGASILTDVDSMSRGLLFWRSLTHWLGGMGVLVFVMAIMEKVPDRSINILRAEMPGHSVDKLVPRSRSTAKILYYIYLALTVLEIVFLLCGGMPLYDSIASYSHYLQWVITVFMLLFGVSFSLYYLILLRKWKAVLGSNELRCYLGIGLASFVIITINIYPMYGNIADAVRLSAFQVSSLLTTTGYATADFDLWPQLSKAVLFLLMFSGGCMGSTAGGLKISRIVVLAQSVRNELRRALLPRSVSSVKLNGRRLDPLEVKAVHSYFAIYLSVIIAVFLLISFEPFGMETNLSAAVSCVNNIGPGFALIGPSSGYAAYSGFSKLVLSLAMLLGRLEIFPMLLLFSPQLWSKR